MAFCLCVLCQRLVVCYLLTVVVVSPQGCMPEQPIHLYFDLIYTGGIGCCCWRVDVLFGLEFVFILWIGLAFERLTLL